MKTRRTLFENERSTLKDALAMTEASLCAYGEDRRHWRIAFSGGKDSSATVAAVCWLIETKRVPRPRSIGLIYADTRLELPNLQEAAAKMLREANDRGYRTETVLPRMDKRFYVMMLGRGIPPSHSGFRWCTGALKVEPMADAMRRERVTIGEKLLLITGMRIGESANRDKRIAMSCGKNGGECGQGWYEETTPGEVADVLSPLLHWRTCHVWDWLMLHGKEHGYDCRSVAEVYDQDAEGSAHEILARTGCMVCPVAARDLALERTIRKAQWKHLSPLLGLREIYARLSMPKNRLQKIGERCTDGRLSSNPMRLGPLTLECRRAALAEVLDIQEQVNRAARSDRRLEISLINEEERDRIEELIDAGTWPHGWNGDETTGDELNPIVFSDGSVQNALFRSE